MNDGYGSQWWGRFLALVPGKASARASASEVKFNEEFWDVFTGLLLRNFIS